MKNNRMQCRDIPTEPILRELAKHIHALDHTRWSSLFECHERSLWPAFPQGTPINLAHAKMRRLIQRGWVHGDATVGNRGDFTISRTGMLLLWAICNVSHQEALL